MCFFIVKTSPRHRQKLDPGLGFITNLTLKVSSEKLKKKKAVMSTKMLTTSSRHSTIHIMVSESDQKSHRI